MYWIALIANIVNDVVGSSLRADAASVNAKAEVIYTQNSTEYYNQQVLKAVYNMKFTERQINAERLELQNAIQIKKNLDAFQRNKFKVIEQQAKTATLAEANAKKQQQIAIKTQQQQIKNTQTLENAKVKNITKRVIAGLGVAAILASSWYGIKYIKNK